MAKHSFKHMMMAALLALPLATAADFPKTLDGGWRYAWGDEFNGNKLDTTKWKHELGVIRNQTAKQCYTEDCVQVRDGKLILISKAEETENCNYDPSKKNWTHQIKSLPYASGSVTTRNVKHFEAPGRLEFKAKVPKARGVWPALWTMHVNQYGWPANGEIDILEHISQEPNRCYSLFRWGKDGGNIEHKVIRTTNIPDYSKDFHTYVLEWDDEIMRILIDDKEVGKIRIEEANYPDGNNPLRTPCYLIMNTAIGGWAQAPVAADYPVQFEIDYVRYYTKGDKTKKNKKKKDGKKKKRNKKK